MGAAIIVNDGAGSWGAHQYLFGWLRWSIQQAGLAEKDIEFVSLCDVEDLKLLFAPKTRGVRIVGGSYSFHAQLLGTMSDAVCVGEGQEFFDTAKNKGLDTALSLPCIYTPEKKTVIASSKIEWERFPPIKTNAMKVMVVAERGCHNKCKFCYTSWTTKHQCRPKTNYVYPGHMIHLISNDNEQTMNQRTSVRSITAKRYLAMTKGESKLCRFYRIGLESFSEATRKFLGKPALNDEIREIIHVATKENHELQFFIIAGIDPQESIEEFLEQCGGAVGLKRRPGIFIKVTGFNPCLYTPMAGQDLRKTYPWNKKYVWAMLKSGSIRFRSIMRTNVDGYGMWRGLMYRVTDPDTARRIWAWRSKPRPEIEDLVAKYGYERLYTEIPEKIVRFDWRN